MRTAAALPWRSTRVCPYATEVPHRRHALHSPSYVTPFGLVAYVLHRKTEKNIPSIVPVLALLRELQNLYSACTGTQLSSARCRYCDGSSRLHIPAV